MSKTHTLVATSGGETLERKVDSQERFIVKVGVDLRSWPVRELERVEIAEGYPDEHTPLLVQTQAGGSYMPLVRGARIAFGSDEWDVSQVVSFMLAPIPKPKPPEPKPL